MKRDEFAELVDGFRIRPVMPPAGQRHVYLWHGDLPALTPLLARANGLSLDLHELTRSLERKPTDLNAARRVLEDAIAGRLREHPHTENVASDHRRNWMRPADALSGVVGSVHAVRRG